MQRVRFLSKKAKAVKIANRLSGKSVAQVFCLTESHVNTVQNISSHPNQQKESMRHVPNKNLTNKKVCHIMKYAL